MRILLVDVPGTTRAATASWLEMVQGVETVEVATSGVEALQLLGNGAPPHVVLVDSQLADISVFEFVRRAKARWLAPKVVIMARVLTERLLAAARAAGADHGIEKISLQKELPRLLVG